jgi:hypothetical protein
MSDPARNTSLEAIVMRQQVDISTADGTIGALLVRPVTTDTLPGVPDVAGPELRQARESGWQIAEDGWQYDL